MESGLTLDLGRLIRQGWAVPGECKSGSLFWTLVRTGERVGWISYQANMLDPSESWLRLMYTTTHRSDGSKIEIDYQVRLDTTHPHLGGVRWWFVCPLTGCRAAKLHLPPGAHRFGCRTAWRLPNQSQRNGPLFRAQEREARIIRKLGGNHECPDTPTPPRPKWMRHKTYDRLCAEHALSLEAQDVAFVAGVRGFMARRGR